MTTKIFLINCTSSVRKAVELNYPELVLCDDSSSFDGGVVLESIDRLDFDLEALVATNENTSLVELQNNDTGFALDKMGKLTSLDSEKVYVDSFYHIGAYRLMDRDSLTHLKDVKDTFSALIGATGSREFSRSEFKKALFLDRDGILNHDGGYLFEFEKMSFYNEITESLKLFKAHGYDIFVITNQSGIARGYYSEDDVRELHKKMRAHFEKLGVVISAFYHSCHHPDKGVDKYKAISFTRKPYPGMVSMAMREFPITLVDSVMIGDKKSDQLMAFPGTTFHMKRQYDLSNSSAQIFENYEELKMFLASKFFKGQN